MTWWQILVQAGVMVIIFGIFFVIGSYLKGKQIKSGIREINRLCRKKTNQTESFEGESKG